MKKYNLLLLGSVVSLFFSCQKEDFKNELTEEAKQGGLIKLTPTVNYEIGKGNAHQYNAFFSIDQGRGAVTKSIDIYKTFTDTKGTATPTDDVVSQEVLHKSISLSSVSQKVFLKLSYNDLRQDILLGGMTLPVNETDLKVGDYWTLRYVSNLDYGTPINLGTTKVSIGTAYSGNYKVNSAKYFRIGVDRDDVILTNKYLEAIISIEAITPTLYKINDWWGPFQGNELYFTISGTTITYPANRPDGTPQVGNSQPLITCQSAPAELSNVGCATSNFVTIDNDNNRHKLTMSFGYLNAPGQSREFYQILQKL